MTLTVTDHNRDILHNRYVYPVVSRRAGGVSVGINLNPNSACNWRCIYCSVPNLTRGSAPPIDLDLLAQELRSFLQDAVHGDFLKKHVAEPARTLMDIAFSGNGEPTSAKELPDIIHLVAQILSEFGLERSVKIRLITNGSLMDKKSVLDTMALLSAHQGEVWFKLDTALEAGFARINDVSIKPKTHLRRLRACAMACPTYVQTCMFALDGEPPDEAELQAYLDAIDSVKDVIKGVLLYGIARASFQPEAPRLTRLSEAWLEKFAARIRALGVKVQVSE